MEYTPTEWIKDNLVTNKKIKKLVDAVAELAQRIQGVIPQPTAEDDGKTVIARNREWVIGDFPSDGFDCTFTVSESGIRCENASIEEIIEMVNNDVKVYGVFENDGTVIRSLIIVLSETPAKVFFSFAMPNDDASYGVDVSGLIGFVNDETDTWIAVNTITVPAISNSDNGKTLVAEVNTENEEVVKRYRLKQVSQNEIINIAFGTGTATFGKNASEILDIIRAGNTPIFKNINAGVVSYYYLFKRFVLEIGNTSTFYMILCDIDGLVDDIYSVKNVHFIHVQFTDETNVANCEVSSLIPDYGQGEADAYLKVNNTGTGLEWVAPQPT